MDKASSCCCPPLVRLLQTFWFSHGNPLAVIHLSVRGVVSPHGFSARHAAPWHCLGGFEPQRHPTPLFSLPSSSKPHGTAQLPSPRSCSSSLPSPIPPALLPASYSHLVSPLHGAHLRTPTMPLGIPDTNQMQPRTTVLCSLSGWFGFFKIFCAV